ncbi:MAG: hypothetical protein KC466_03170 [Myxococcales bacterium]|nr:hypothetical protein [Myxococcales bacterium]
MATINIVIITSTKVNPDSALRGAPIRSRDRRLMEILSPSDQSFDPFVRGLEARRDPKSRLFDESPQAIAAPDDITNI